MDASVFLSHAKKALGDRAWTVELVLHVGAELAQAVNSLKNLSGKDKSELVCQTILKLLDDGETAEKERVAGSTGKETTKVPWGECRQVVKTLLPASLELIVKASRGEISLPKGSVSCLSRVWKFLRLPSKDRVSEVRDLVLRVETMLKEAQALPEASKRLHPAATPAPNAVSLPGESPIRVEVSASQ
jgi:hypothetical protein